MNVTFFPDFSKAKWRLHRRTRIYVKKIFFIFSVSANLLYPDLSHRARAAAGSYRLLFQRLFLEMHSFYFDAFNGDFFSLIYPIFIESKNREKVLI